MLSKLVRPAIAGFLALFLVSCGLHSRASLTDESLAQVDPRKVGHVAGSIGVLPSWYRYSSYTMYVCDSRMNEVMQFHYWQKDLMFGHTPDIDQSDMEGIVFDLALPEGDYSFCDFRLFQNSAYYQASYSAKEKFSVPFSVKAGKVSYLGEFRCVPVTGENIFGLPVLAGGYWVVRDQQERDMPIVLSKTPELADLEISTVVPDVESYGNPLLRAEVQPEAE